MLYLWTAAKAKWLLVALLLFCMHLHETKSIVYFDHFWCRLKRTMNKWILNYLWKLCWILVGMFNKKFHFVMYIKISQDIANVCLPSDFFHDSFWTSYAFLMMFYWNVDEKRKTVCSSYAVWFFDFQPKTIPFCKTIIMTFSKQHTSCIWTAHYFFPIAYQKFKIVSSKWQKIESDRALTRSFLWSL